MRAAPTLSLPGRGLLLRGVLLAAAMFACVASSRAAVLPPDVVFEGRTLSEWTVEAWRWIYSVPASKSPSTDCQGQWANENQPGGSVFFVAPLNGQVPPPCVRTFSVPAGKYLLVPVLPITADNIDTLPPLEIEQLYDALDSVTTEVEYLYATIDGVALTNLHQYRATAPPLSYHFRQLDNHFSSFYGHAVIGLVDPILVDGYWFLLEPLPPGLHVLHTKGRFNGPADYFKPHEILANITVVAANRPPIADASATRLRVLSPNHETARVVLDGSRSSDPDGDALTFAWMERGSIIARGAVASCSLRAGSHAIDLVVGDGTLRATNTIVIRVWTVSSAIQELMQTVESSDWSHGNARPLLAALKSAQRAFERGDFRQAVRHLQSFQTRLKRRMAERDSAAAGSLNESAQEIILALEERSR